MFGDQYDDMTRFDKDQIRAEEGRMPCPICDNQVAPVDCVSWNIVEERTIQSGDDAYDLVPACPDCIEALEDGVSLETLGYWD